MEFQWWYILILIFIIFIFFGKSKGGVVVKRFVASLEILDERFEGCRTEAKYHIFKKGPDHIEIEVERLSIPVDEELEIQVNGSIFAKVKVQHDKEAEFDFWSDEGVDFPIIKEGDELTIRYQGVDVLTGTFRING